MSKVFAQCVVFCSFLLLFGNSVLCTENAYKNDKCLSAKSIIISVNYYRRLNKDKIFVLVFTKSQDVNIQDVDSLQNKNLKIIFKCKNDSNKNVNDSEDINKKLNSKIVSIKKGKVIKQKSYRKFTKVNLFDFIKDTVNLINSKKILTSSTNKINTINHSNDSDAITKHSLYITENKIIDFNKSNQITNFINLNVQMLNEVEKVNKGLRFLQSFILLLVSSALTYLFVKTSVDWATYSKGELNKYRDLKASLITTAVNNRFNYIRRTD